MNPGRPLRRSRDFQRLYAGGRKLVLDGLTVYVARREDPSLPARLGLSVPASSLTAVARNRVKRRLRAAFAHCGVAGVDVVLRGGAGVLTAPFQMLVERVCRGIRAALMGAS